MECFCYILKCSDGSYYTGWSRDPARRLVEHNRGTGAKYTRSRLPAQLVYVESCPDVSTALKRERALKALSHAQKEKISGDQILPG